MRERLQALGVAGVRARTFHATALAQLHHFAPETGDHPAVEGDPARADRALAAPGVPVPPARRVRNRDRVGEEPPAASGALPRRAGRPPAAGAPGPDAPGLPRLRGAQAPRGRIDFEDVLELLVRVYESSPAAIRAVPARRAARSPSTSTRTSTCSSRRCSTSGSASATTSASSVTTTRRSTRSPARRPQLPPADALAVSPVRPWSGSRRTTARRRRFSGWRTGSCRVLGGAEKTLRAVPAAGLRARAPIRIASDRRGGRRDRRGASVSCREDGVREDEIAVLYRVNARSDDLEGQLACSRAFPTRFAAARSSSGPAARGPPAPAASGGRRPGRRHGSRRRGSAGLPSRSRTGSATRA